METDECSCPACQDLRENYWEEPDIDESDPYQNNLIYGDDPYDSTTEN